MRLKKWLKNRTEPEKTAEQTNELPPAELKDTIKGNIEQIKELLGDPIDFNYRFMDIADTQKQFGIVFIEGKVDKPAISAMVLRNISEVKKSHHPGTGSELLHYLKNTIISVTRADIKDNLDEVMRCLIEGSTILFVDGAKEALVLFTPTNWEGRAIQEPVTEPLIRGPRDGFTESLKTNIILLRDRIRDYNLRIENFYIGRRSKKLIAISYIKGITHPDLINEVKRRLATIDIDDAMESGIVEQWIEDSFLSPFPQMTSTERPDKVASSLMNGQFCIILEGTPFVLIGPITITSTLHSPEDYYERWQAGTLLRLLRYSAAFVTIFLPAAYVALAAYHPGMIPSHLAFSMASTREGVPFPAVMEAILMETTMELLREAGVRLPKPIGQTIGIVGGLIIGEAAVTAGIVSPIMVIIVALTAVASFSLPYYGLAISFRVLRFTTILAAGIFGIYGIIIVYIIINVHLANLKSFGVPYTAPIAPTFLKDWKEAVIRAPITMLGSRYRHMQPQDEQRMNFKRKGGSERK